MTAAVQADVQHGTLAGLAWHYRNDVAVCAACQARLQRHQRERRVASKKAAEQASVSVVPFGWPCTDCEWTERLGTSDGRVVSWRVERCPKHQGAW